MYFRQSSDNSAYIFIVTLLDCNLAAQHDKVTNGSRMLQTQQCPLIYNTVLTISGNSSIDFEVIACNFLSVHQIQCRHGRAREKYTKKVREEKEVAAVLSF